MLFRGVDGINLSRHTNVQLHSLDRMMIALASNMWKVCLQTLEQDISGAMTCPDVRGAEVQEFQQRMENGSKRFRRAVEESRHRLMKLHARAFW